MGINEHQGPWICVQISECGVKESRYAGKANMIYPRRGKLRCRGIPGRRAIVGRMRGGKRGYFMICREISVS